MPAASAIARPVQWVASPGGSAQVSRDHALGHGGAQRRLAGLAGGIAQQAVDAGRDEALLPAPHRGPADPGAPGDTGGGQPLGRAEDDPSARDMLLRAVAIGDDRLETSTILSRDQGTYLLSHRRSMSQPHRLVNFF